MGKNARTFGQDLMRGEHIVGAPKHSKDLRPDDPNARLAIRTDSDPYREAAARQTASLQGGTTFNLTAHPYDASADTTPTAGQTGTSIFDPVLTELAYRWFCPPGGIVLDPFAGGSVRGIVASRLDRYYVGCELRQEQVSANRAQATKICAGFKAPIWHQGDSAKIIPHLDLAADFVFSCPPYGDQPDDLSAMPHEKFVDVYRDIIAKACAKLRDDRFACFVVGDFRDKAGNYRDFVSTTIKAFRDAGLALYNEVILVTAAGSLPIRAGKQFEATRKLGKTHQNVLVFLKGDARRATKACGPVKIDPAFFAGAEADADGDADDDESEPAPAARPPARAKAPPFSDRPRQPEPDDNTPDLTPIERHGDVWLKRDDLWAIAGVAGGKVRTCWALAQAVKDRPGAGLVTAGSRASPQVNIVAHIAARLGVGCRAHTPTGKLSPEVAAAQRAGAEIIQHKAGYNNVIVARARDDAAALGWVEIPFGMECEEAVRQTSAQIAPLPDGVKRLVVPVGSGMSLAGILTGLARASIDVPVLGVVVGADPIKRLDRYAPPHWRDLAKLVPAGVDYHEAVAVDVGGVLLDPHYEAKCVLFLEPGDMLWLVGIRATA